MVEVFDPRFKQGSGILMLKIPILELETYGLPWKTFEGAVIDLETNEQPFLDNLKGANRFKNHTVTCCGFLDRNAIEIIARTDELSDESFVKAVNERLNATTRPYHAFNAGCDMALISKLLKRPIPFDQELQRFERQNKEYYRQDLGLPNFGDPYRGQGYIAAKEWTRYLETRDIECIKKIMAHNFACLCTEYGFLIKKGCRAIDPRSHVPFFDGRSDLTCNQ